MLLLLYWLSKSCPAAAALAPWSSASIHNLITHPVKKLSQGGVVCNGWHPFFWPHSLQIMEDLYDLFMRYRKARNFIVGHCYGCIHSLRLMKRLRDEGEAGSVKGMVLISLGTNLPVPAGASLFLRLPTTVMGK